MKKQLIISVGREFGSGGHVIAEALAERFGLPMYDSNILEKIADEKNISSETLSRYDERPKSKLFSRTVRGFSNSMSENIANMQFDFLKKKASGGESFVIVGRCAETKLKGFDGLVSIFILGDRKTKLERIMELYGLDEQAAVRLLEREDAKRKFYHNDHCKVKWGDSRNYDISVNSSKLGIQKTIDFLEKYIKARVENMQ